MDISSQEIEAIVKQVLAGMGGAQTSAAPAAYTAAPGGAAGDRGVFENVDDAVEAAWKAQRDWAANYKIEDRQRIIEAIRRCARAHVEEWCHKIVEETGMGRYEDKVEKHLAVINKTPGPECLTTEAKSGDAGLMLEEYAPFGVICSITPTTNPTETIINNTISMIAGGNTVVFNVHPRAKRVSADCLQALNTAIIEAGGPANLITMTREPTMENVDKMAANPKIRLMAGTGGMGMVNALLRSGKKCIGACILPYFEDGTICMVRQFRYAMQQELWELPAGKLEKGEDPFEAAKRELGEECGLTADNYISLGQFFPTVGYDTEVIYTWVATGLHKTQMHLDADEFLTPDRVPLDKAYEMVMSGEIRDGKTIAGILKLKALIAEGRL